MVALEDALRSLDGVAPIAHDTAGNNLRDIIKTIKDSFDGAVDRYEADRKAGVYGIEGAETVDVPSAVDAVGINVG